jgi:hypothetical protein
MVELKMIELPKYINDESYKVYVTYLAMKRHFTSPKYDYHKYNGRVSASFDSFKKRTDAYYFAKLSKNDDYENVLLAHMIKNPNTWIRDVVEDDYIYFDWKKKIDALGYTFKSELKNLDDDWKTNFISHGGQHPLILTLRLQQKISLETFTILTHVANIFDYWEQNLLDKYVASDIIQQSRKYFPFLMLDVKRFKTMVKDHFDI